MEPLLLSKSRLNAFCQCPEKYRLTYVEKIRNERTPVAMVEGSALHHIVENALVYGRNIPHIAKVSSAEFWSGIVWETTEYPDAAAYEAAQENILAEATEFLDRIGPLNTYQMETYFEHPLVHPVNGEVDDSILLRGYADIIDSPAKDVTRIIDIKTSAKSPNREQANRALELTVYAYLMACRFGFHIEVPVALLYLVRAKEKKVLWLNSERSLPDFVKAYETMQTVARAIRQGLYWKNQGLHCSWCDHQELCFAKRLAA